MIRHGRVWTGRSLRFRVHIRFRASSDADHIVAVSTLVSENRNLKKASMLGVFWGLGHTATLILAGMLILVFAVAIPPSLALFFEFMVGIILIMLGLSVITKTSGKSKHVHSHTHNGKEHIHFHNHNEVKYHNHAHKSFIVGMFHGLAGTATLVLLVLSSIDSIYEGASYILIFGIGSIIGMMIISTLIGLPIVYAHNRLRGWNTRIRIIVGSLSIIVGFTIMYQVAIIGGLIL